MFSEKRLQNTHKDTVTPPATAFNFLVRSPRNLGGRTNIRVGYEMIEESRFDPRQGKLPSQWILGALAGKKQPVRDAGHSHLPSAEVKERVKQ
jgi:hypothetical protein